MSDHLNTHLFGELWDRVARDLPPYWTISVCVGGGDLGYSVELCDAEGKKREFPSNHESIPNEVQDALAYATRENQQPSDAVVTAILAALPATTAKLPLPLGWQVRIEGGHIWLTHAADHREFVAPLDCVDAASWLQACLAKVPTAASAAGQPPRLA